MFDWRDSRLISFQITFIVKVKRLSSESFELVTRCAYNNDSALYYMNKTNLRFRFENVRRPMAECQQPHELEFCHKSDTVCKFDSIELNQQISLRKLTFAKQKRERPTS